MQKTPKQQIILIAISTALAGFSLASIIAFTDPQNGGFVTYTAFYLSLFLTSLGIFTVLGLVLRQWFWKGLYITDLSHSFRQALLISILLIASLNLQSHGLLYWWVEGTLILFLSSVEAFLNLKV